MATKPKRPRDINQLAKSIVDQATCEIDTQEEQSSKNPAAVALGKLGGKKGGEKRMSLLSDEEKKALALKAAKARWSKAKTPQ